MKIAIAQINATVGDLGGNVTRLAEFAARARNEGADLMVTPELALSGYPPEDLLLREDFLAACDQALADLAKRSEGVTLVVGHPRVADGKRYNAASVIQNGKVLGIYDKQRLPNYTVFDEERYFEPGDKPCVFGVDGVSFGVNICEDTWGALGRVTARQRGEGSEERLGINICADSWNATATRAAREAGANVLLVLNASPYHLDKQRVRYDVMRERVAENGLALV